MAKRIYNFELPLHVSSMYAAMLPNALQSMGIWDKLPSHLRDKANKAATSWSGIDITKEDLDSLDENTWKILENQLINKYLAPKTDDSYKPTENF